MQKPIQLHLARSPKGILRVQALPSRYFCGAERSKLIPEPALCLLAFSLRERVRAKTHGTQPRATEQRELAVYSLETMNLSSSGTDRSRVLRRCYAFLACFKRKLAKRNASDVSARLKHIKLGDTRAMQECVSQENGLSVISQNERKEFNILDREHVN